MTPWSWILPRVRRLEGGAWRLVVVYLGGVARVSYTWKAGDLCGSGSMRFAAMGDRVARFGVRVARVPIPVPWLRLDHERPSTSHPRQENLR